MRMHDVVMTGSCGWTSRGAEDHCRSEKNVDGDNLRNKRKNADEGADVDKMLTEVDQMSAPSGQQKGEVKKAMLRAFTMKGGT